MTESYYDPKADWGLIPAYMKGAVERYVMRGIPPGSFLTAILANDFMGAAGRADYDNGRHLKDWAVFIYCWTPSNCHGSPKAVDAWIAKGGLLGHLRATAGDVAEEGG